MRLMTAPGVRFHGEPPLWVTSALLARAGVPHCFTTRHFPGATAPEAPSAPLGREALDLLVRQGLGPELPAFARQVHGARVLTTRSPGLAGEADALLTDRPGLPLAVFTADCLGVVLYDPDGPRLAVIHAGWRGTAASAAGAAARVLAAAGGRPERFLAAIGPSIGPCCYEADRPVIERLERAFGDGWRQWAAPRGPGRWMLDLWGANEAQLRSVGLRPEHIDNPRLCTACRQDLFFSYRRGRGQGRLVAAAALTDGSAPAC
jgi:YfiH family protein